MPCYHIIRKHASMSSSPALKRCFRSRSHADTVRVRGAIGDRSDYYLDQTLPGLAVSACYDPDNCECAKWPQGHNAAAIPVKESRSLIMCEQCTQGRRNAVEMIDPKTEEPAFLCERCAGRAALGFLFKRQLAPVRRVHADDAAMVMVVTSSVG